MNTIIEAPVRLAIRREGKYVNAYLAQIGTMDDAVLLGSILHRLAQNADYFDAWKACMKHGFGIAIEEVTGGTIASFEERPGPEHERSGNT